MFIVFISRPGSRCFKSKGYLTALLHYYVTTLLHYYIYYITTSLHHYITTLPYLTIAIPITYHYHRSRCFKSKASLERRQGTIFTELPEARGTRGRSYKCNSYYDYCVLFIMYYLLLLLLLVVLYFFVVITAGNQGSVVKGRF